MGWGLGPVSFEGWALILVFVVAAVSIPLADPHQWWIVYPVLAALLIVIFLKGTSPGGSQAWAEYKAANDRRDSDPGLNR